MQQQVGGGLEVSWDETTHVPRFLSGQIPTEKVAISGAGTIDAEATARAFFHNFANLYQMRQPEPELGLIKTISDKLGMIHVRFRQQVNSVPVFGAMVVAHLNSAGQITAVNGEYIHHIALDTTPTLSFDEALAIVRRDLKDDTAELFPDRSELAIYARNHLPVLTWQVNVYSTHPLGNWLYFIDANTGEIVHRLNQMETHLSPQESETNTSTSTAENLPDNQEIEPLAVKSIKTYKRRNFDTGLASP